MASVQVAAIGPSDVLARAKIEEVARKAQLSLSPVNVRAGFTAGATTETHEVIQSIHGPSLSEDDIRERLAPYEDETTDPTVGVRFVVLP